MLKSFILIRNTATNTSCSFSIFKNQTRIVLKHLEHSQPSTRSFVLSKILCNSNKNNEVTGVKSNDSKQDSKKETTKTGNSETPQTKNPLLDAKLFKFVVENSSVESADGKKEQKPKILEKIQAIFPKEAAQNIEDKTETKQESEESKTAKRKRKRVDISVASFERNFITPAKAISEFLLKTSDLDSLPKTRRRSPYESESLITLYWRKDVQAKAIEVWGSRENIKKEIFRRELERRQYEQNIFTSKKHLKDSKKETIRNEIKTSDDGGLMSGSGKVIIVAVAINALNFVFKLVAWIHTGSHSMFSECIHSLADTINQLILAYGVQKSVQMADANHPYGYSNIKYVTSLISGVGIFCVGSGLSFYHGVTGLLNPQPVEDLYWAYIVLFGSLISEGGTCIIAFTSVRNSAKKAQVPLFDFIARGQEPSVNVVLLEDFAAVLGVLVAGCCISLSTAINSPIPDILGCLAVGTILATVASFIIYTNTTALVGRSIPQSSLEKINAELEGDVMIRAIHDVKGIDMGNSLVRYKAELDFDGRELTKMYLDKQDLTVLLEDVGKIKDIDQLEEFLLKHGENIVDLMGGEIDRIELKLRSNHPEIRHCDLEIL